MAFVLVRIDDRLLHGQVTHGWCPGLSPELIVVADDGAASDAWEREAYESSGPPTVPVRVERLDELAARALSGELDATRVLLLVRGPQELLALVEAGVGIREANVGGLRGPNARVSFARDLRLGRSEARAFVALGRAGVSCYYQPLPGDPRRELPELDSLAGAEDEPCGS